MSHPADVVSQIEICKKLDPKLSRLSNLTITSIENQVLDYGR